MHHQKGTRKINDKSLRMVFEISLKWLRPPLSLPHNRRHEKKREGSPKNERRPSYWVLEK